MNELDAILNTAIQSHRLSSTQQDNIKHLFEISKRFHSDAGIPGKELPEVSSETIILESGHQPNFFPHAGTWKKAFLLHHFSKKIAGGGKPIAVFYGFADQNLSTTPLLFRNQVPALNKTGAEKIGLKNKDDLKHKWICCNRMEKPSSEIWLGEMEKIAAYYRSSLNRLAGGSFAGQDEISPFLELLHKSYEKAATLSDINAFAFSKTCSDLLHLDIRFFRYSDLQTHRLFINEYQKVLIHLKQFNQIYNRAIDEYHLNLNPVSTDSVPFWYHCDCGGKLFMKITDEVVMEGSCPLCGKIFQLPCDADFNGIGNQIRNMGLNAVTRNLVLSEGIGTSVFISGAGGSLDYGRISDLISREFQFNTPLTIAWKSKDFYLSLIHKNGLQDLVKTNKITLEEIISSAAIRSIENRLSGMRNNIESIERDEHLDKIRIKVERNAYNNFRNQLLNIKAAFSTVPSMMDLFASMEVTQITSSWCDAVEHCSFEYTHSNQVKMIRDICYEDKYSGIKSEDIKKIYDNVASLKV